MILSLMYLLNKCLLLERTSKYALYHKHSSTWSTFELFRGYILVVLLRGGSVLVQEWFTNKCHTMRGIYRLLLMIILKQANSTKTKKENP